ncbi:helix-turn-helix domain-containing protein [Streptomyces roseoviridis]|uniref:Helix-turn-helix domain-containing protein n=1 Tax=Streptomyces roseoviridis TaxID=67361 RepID=A0ABV5QXW9_9ACTN
MSSALARLSVGTARLAGVPDVDYAHLLGLAPEYLGDDRCRIPSATTVRIAELATGRLDWPDLAALLTGSSHVGALGVWDYLITAAPTPLQGIRDAADLFATVADAGSDHLQVSVDGGQVTISHSNRADMAHEAACAVRAYGLGLYRRRLGEAARRGLTPVKVSLAAAAPKRHDTLVRLYGTRAIDFEAPTSSITFLTTDLTVRSPHAQPGLSPVLRQHAENTLSSARPLHIWLDLFHAALESARGEEDFTLEAVARRMSVSARTLQRRLVEHGTTWSSEVDKVRRDRVTRLLRDTELSVEAIAGRTGYADARALRRAVQRWHGTTPASLRHTVFR